MAANNVLGIVFSNIYDEVIPELTSVRTMGSIPFAGRYRLIDFQLSSMVNSGISKVGVITKSNYRSLMDHLGSGKPWDLSRKREGLTILPPFNAPGSGAFAGRIDALYGSIDFITKSQKEYTLLTESHIICNMDYEDLLKKHIATGADITVCYKYGVAPNLPAGLEYTLEDTVKLVSVLTETQRIVAANFVEQHEQPVNFSMSMMIIKTGLLEKLVREAHASGIHEFNRILANNVDRLNIRGYEEPGYVRVVDSLQSYFNINLELLNKDVRDTLFSKDRPIYTKVRDEVPAVYGMNAKGVNSLIADGCVIEGEVSNSILFRGVHIGKGTVVSNSIIMQDAFVGDAVRLENVIIDKECIIKNGKTLCGADDYPVYVAKGKVI